MDTRSGWILVQETAPSNSAARWCMLDNGVMWMFRQPGENEGKDALPLHDVVICASDSPPARKINVRCRRSGRVLVLSLSTPEEHADWFSALSTSARYWREKRRASVLNRQLMTCADSDDDKDEFGPEGQRVVLSSVRRLSECAGAPPFSARNALDHRCPPLPKPQTLRAISLEAGHPARWSRLPLVIASGLLDVLTPEHVALEELKFSAVLEEFRYNAELINLTRLATRAVCRQDAELPAFHRRSIVISLNKVKRASDRVITVAEKHWQQKITLQTVLFSWLGTEARTAGWREVYEEYCSHLAELRHMLRNTIQESLIRNRRYDVEMALVPIQHLTTLRQLMQTIFELVPVGTTEQHAARETRNFLNEILDVCYQQLTQQNGSEYVAKMDNALQFDLTNVTSGAVAGPPLLFRRPCVEAPTPSYHQNQPPCASVTEEDEVKFRRISKSKSRPSIFQGATKALAHLRRKTKEGLRQQLSHRSASLPTIAFELCSTAVADESGDSDKEGTTHERSSQESSDEPFNVPRFFTTEPLYQDYCLFAAQEFVAQALQEKADTPHASNVKDARGCSRWSAHSKVQELESLSETSCDERRLAEAKFELLVSEVAYLRSLGILEGHFARCPDFYDEEVLRADERRLLFHGLEEHRSCSERFIFCMERCWERDTCLGDLCRKVHRHMISVQAKAAAAACTNQLSVVKLLQKLTKQPYFSAVFVRLEKSVICGGHSMESFVSLPPRRFGRIQLLLENIARLMRLLPEVPVEERIACEKAQDAATHLASIATAAARRYHSDETLQLLSRNLSFRRLPRVPLTAEGRVLLYQGTWRIMGRRVDARGPMRSKAGLSELHAILVSDLLVFATADGIGGFTAVDYCARSSIELRTAGPGMEEPLPGYLQGDREAKNAMYVKFIGHTGRLVEMVVYCGSLTERSRWLSAAYPEQALHRSPGKRSTLVRVVRQYAPLALDEAHLLPGDVLAVITSTGDGWSHGCDVLHGCEGWFPSAFAVQVVDELPKGVYYSSHSARNDNETYA